MKDWPRAKFGMFWVLAITLVMANSLQADNFAGSYNPMMEYDDNISDGVTIQQDYSSTLVVSTADAEGHRTVTLSDGSNTVEIDTVESASGDRIYNPTRSVAYSGWHLIDFIMVSDGVNKAFAMIGQEDSDPLYISFIVGSWSDVSPVLSPADFAGTSSSNSYSDPNLRDVPEGFSQEGQPATTITESGQSEIVLSGSSPEGFPFSFTLGLSGNTARLVDPPFTSDDGVHHTFQITSDGLRSSGYMVTAELEDASDVSVSLFLGRHAGDFDGDGDVDGTDFGLWQSGYPTASGATWNTGDVDGDSDVDGTDFGIWQANYPTNVGSVATIPEPATLGLLIMGGLLLVRRRLG